MNSDGQVSHGLVGHGVVSNGKVSQGLVSQGRDFLAIPGPTVVPDQVLSAMHRPAIDIYTGSLMAVTDSCLAALKSVFKTGGDVYMYAANGHGAWEAALSNVLSRGDEILVLQSGLFAATWGESGALQGLKAQVVAGDWNQPVNYEKAEEALRSDKNHNIKALLAVQIDTASGVVNDVPRLRRLLDDTNHPALLMIDCIASLGTMPFLMDEWRVDVAVAGSQKGLMMPPGLSFVATNAKGKAAHQNANLRTHYWDWTFRDGPEHYMKYCGTPPEHLMFGLKCALDMLFEEGLDAAFMRHQLLADAVRSAVSAWGGSGLMSLNIQDPSARANSVTTVVLADGMAPEVLLDWCEVNAAVKLGITIGDLHGKGFRIGHMGYVNAPMILGVLGVIESALYANDWEFASSGVAAATEQLGSALKSI